MRKDAVQEQVDVEREGQRPTSAVSAAVSDAGTARAGAVTGETSIAGAAAAASDADQDEGGGLLTQLTDGTVVDGKYRIDRIIGRGAMGVVAAATHIHLRERVALKFLYVKTNTATEDFHSRFRREAQVSAKMRNEHITRVIDVGVWREKAPFMVMDYLEGRDLRQVLKASAGPLPLSTVIDYMVQVCEGMAEAHGYGIIHRDLKPSNLFVTTRPDGSDLVKILDFGISKWSADETEMEELTQTGVVLGSPKYMSPEQLFGSSAVDPRADVWSIGAIFYELLAGRPPYNEPTLARICAELASDKAPPSLRAINPEIPAALEEAVFSCFARDRESRMANVAELAGAALDAVGAPFAGNVRLKIAAMLDARAAREGLGSNTSGASMMGGVSGGYGSLSLSGTSNPTSGSGPRSLRGGTGSYSAAAALGAHAPSVPSSGDIRISTAPEKPNRAPIVAVAVVGALFAVVGIGGYVAVSHGHAATEKPAALPVEVQSTKPAPHQDVAPQQAPAQETAAALRATAVETAPASSGAAATSPGSNSSKPAPSLPAASPHAYSGGYHPAAHPVPASAAPVAAPAPVVAAAPAVTPPPTPDPVKKPKVNPLEDRQ